MLTDATLNTFLTELASRAPTPGGGSASALGGAIGTALANMAAAYTSGEKYLSVEPRVLELARQLTALRARFIDLMQKDIDAYASYVSARKLPRETDEQKSARAAALELARQSSTAAPEAIIQASVEGFGLLEEFSTLANPNLAGDVAGAAYFLEAAARGAGIQVASNCAAADTGGENAARRATAAARIAECQAARERIDAAVFRMLKL